MIAKYTVPQKTVSQTEFVYSRTSEGFNLPVMLPRFLVLLSTSGFFFIEACFRAHFSTCISIKQQIVPAVVLPMKFMGSTFHGT